MLIRVKGSDGGRLDDTVAKDMLACCRGLIGTATRFSASRDSIRRGADI